MPSAQEPPARRLTQREVNRAVLDRQCLLTRSPAPLTEVLERIAGIQAQYAPSMYIGLWSRMASFSRADLTAALEDASAVQGTLMRATIHLVSRGDYWPFEIAVREARRAWYLRVQRTGAALDDFERAATSVRERLAEGPATSAELGALVGPTFVAGVHEFVDIVRVPPSGTWERRRADLYAAATHWVGDEPDLSPAAATAHLIRRYLGAFGPARPKDVADFAGLPISVVRPVLDSSDTLDTVRYESHDGEELVDLAGASIPDGDTPAPVRFLPTWDATLLVHARRALVLTEEDRPRIFHVHNPHSSATFLVDGTVAGTWTYDKDRVVVDPFRPLSRASAREVDAEAERLAELYAPARRA